MNGVFGWGVDSEADVALTLNALHHVLRRKCARMTALVQPPAAFQAMVLRKKDRMTYAEA